MQSSFYKVQRSRKTEGNLRSEVGHCTSSCPIAEWEGSEFSVCLCYHHEDVFVKNGQCNIICLQHLDIICKFLGIMHMDLHLYSNQSVKGEIRWQNKVRTCLNRWWISSQSETKRSWSQELGKDRPTAEGHLETRAHREAAETTKQHCSDRHLEAVSDLQSDLHQQPGGKGRSTGTQEVNPGIKLPILLFCLIRPWAETEWQSPSRQKQEYSGIQGSDPHQCHSEYHSVYWEKGCGAGGTTASCACTKPGAGSFLAWHIALVPQGK